MSSDARGRLIQRWPIGSGYVALDYEGRHLDSEVLDRRLNLEASSHHQGALPLGARPSPGSGENLSRRGGLDDGRSS